MAKVPLIFPFAGRSDRNAKHRQAALTTVGAQNVRGRDPVTGRMRGAQKSGMLKYNSTVVGASRVRSICSVTRDDRKIAYDFTGGSEALDWARATPSKSDCLNGVTDREGNVYAFNGKASLSKFNPTGTLVMTITLPVEDKGHVCRALVVDDQDRIFAGVSEGGDVATAKVFCILQRPAPGGNTPDPDDENQYFILWELTPGAYTEELRVYRSSQLIAAYNYPKENRSRVLVYQGIGLEPFESARIESVAYPINGMDIGADGSLYCASPEVTPIKPSGVGPSTAHLRPGPPGEPRNHAPIVGWTINDLEDSNSRVWSYYDAESIDETDLVQDDNLTENEVKEGQELLRWRDLSGNNRDLYAGTLYLTAAAEGGPTLQLSGPGGLKSVRFDNSDANTLQSLVTLTNASVDVAQASQQRGMIPAYEGSMWAMFILMRPSTGGGSTDPKVVFYAENEDAGAGSNHGLWVDRTDGDTEPGTFAENIVSYSSETDVDDPGSGGSAEDHADSASYASDNGLVLITILWDGQVNPNDTAKTRCMFRVNGKPIDRFEGLPFASKTSQWLGYGPSVATTETNRFSGEICKILVLDRKDRFDNSTEDKILSHDQLEDASASANQTDNELTRIEAWMVYERGGASILHFGKDPLTPPASGNYPHYYGRDPATDRFPGPPAPGVGGYSDAFENIISYEPLISKHDSAGLLKWVANEVTHADGSGTDSGGIGYGVTVREVDDVVHVYTTGPDATTGTSEVGARKVIDQGDDFSDAQADGAWRHKFTTNADQDYAYPKMATDKFGNLFLPGYNTGAGTIDALHVFQKDPDGSGNAQEITSFALGDAAATAHAIALPPDSKTPDYRGDLTTELAQFAYIFTVEDGVADSNLSVHKLRLVTVDSSATGTPNSVVTVVGVGADIKTVTDSAIATPTGGSGALDATSEYVQCFDADGEFVFLDGLTYKVYNPIEDEVTTLEATSAGEIPPLGKIGCMWRHRLVIGRFADHPGRYAASAQGDIRNWQFRNYRNLATQAFEATLTRAGEVEDSIVALIPASDDLLYVMGTSRILRLTGDPQDGGVIDKVSDDIGGTFGKSWAKTASGAVFFFGNPPGLYLMGPDGPIPVARDTIEDTEFQEIDFSTNRIEMIWDPIEKGIRILQIPHASSTTIVRHWFLEEKTHELVQGPSIWPDVYGSADVQPTAVTYLAGDSTRGILMGCHDGYVRIIDKDAKDDDGIQIDSYVTFGPFPNTPEMLEFLLRTVQVTLASTRDGCRLELFATEESDSIGPIQSHIDLYPGMNDAYRQRLRGKFLFARLRNAYSGQSWAYEQGEVDVVATKSQRRKDR